MQEYADMHVHSFHSDGNYSPREIARYARKAGLKALCLTDHDTVNGIEEILTAGNEFGIEIIPGIEMSINLYNKDIHLLGYGFDFRKKEITDALKEFQKERIIRAENIVAKLNELGISIKMDSVKEIAKDSTLGRPHIAEALVKGGWVKTYEEAFRIYLASWGKAYLPRRTWTLADSIALIHQYGGVVSTAHPGIDITQELFDELIGAGIDGIEVIHPIHTQQETNRFHLLAQKNNLLETGGSDCHGRNGGMVVGSQKVPYEYFKIVKNRTTME